MNNIQNYYNLKKKKNELYKRYNVIYLILKSIGNSISELKVQNNEIILIVKDNLSLWFITSFLKNHYKCQFKELIDICTIDNLLKKEGNFFRFEINYIFLSLKYKQRLRIKIKSTDQEPINSLSSLFSSSNWLERENFDLFGIYFKNHPDLRRILTDYGFEGFPFRKDFPLTGYIEVRYDDTERSIVYEALELSQEFRFFDFSSTWNWNPNNNI